MVDREFTLIEARALLDRIRDQVDELRETQAELREVKRELSALNRRHLNNGRAGDAELRDIQRRQRQLGETASQHVRSIHGTGAMVKGIDQGLIDFPTTIHGIGSYWCWKAGESTIDWWHPRATGFADRRPVADLPDETDGQPPDEPTP